MGGEGLYDIGDRSILSQGCKMDCGNDSKEGRRWGIGVGIGGRGIGCHSDLVNKGVCEEASGKNCRVCSRETNIRALYRRRSDGGFQ